VIPVVRAALAAAVVLLGAGCAGNYRLDVPASVDRPAPELILRTLWQQELVDHELLTFKPQEWASPVITARGLILVGSSAGRFKAIDGHSGKELWNVDLDGPVNSTPLFDTRRGIVFFGADDGKMRAVDVKRGTVLWTYATKGTIHPPPVLCDEVLLFTTGEGRVYALEAATGKWRWQYDRETPEGFTIQGYSGVTVVGKVAYVGFADGILVALRALSGDVVWTRSLKGSATQFFDIDATPVSARGGQLVTASYATGVYSLSPDTGSVRWQYAVEGVEAVVVMGDRIYFSAPKVGLIALDLEGRPIFQQAIAGGVPASPVVYGSYLFLTGTESGLYVASARTGTLLQYFSLGNGISSTAAAGSGLVAVLTNHGWLQVFDIVDLSNAS
jgi:outer membrane protein assembly factor BamB